MDKHLYIHKEYGNYIFVKDELLPKDKRKKPHPYLRKFQKTDLKTWGDYYNLMFDKARKHMQEHASIVFSKGINK